MNETPHIPGGTKTDYLTVYMCNELLDIRYHLYIDNWYTSLNLVHFLRTRSTGTCGTLRKNRAPAPLKNAQVAVGESCARRSGELLVIKYRPKPTKNVLMATAVHDESTQQVFHGIGRHRQRVPYD